MTKLDKKEVIALLFVSFVFLATTFAMAETENSAISNRSSNHSINLISERIRSMLNERQDNIQERHDSLRAAILAARNASNITYGACVSEAAKVRTDCYSEIKDIETECNSPENITMQERTNCRNSYQEIKDKCKTSFKDIKSECWKIRHTFWETLRNYWK